MITSLVFGAFAAIFLILLFNLSDTLHSLLDITRISQNNNLEPADKNQENKTGTTGVKEIGGDIFRGKMPERGVPEKTQNKKDHPEADLPSYSIPLEKIVTDESKISPDRNPEIKDQEVGPGVIDRPKNYVFCVHYASYKKLTEAKTEVARLSDKGFSARFIKTDVPGKGEWFRVYIGEEKTRQEAMNFAAKLKEEGMIKEIYVHKLSVE